MAEQSGGILGPFFYSLTIFTILYVLMMRFRLHTLKLQEDINNHAL